MAEPYRHSAFDEQPGLELNVHPAHDNGLELIEQHLIQSPAPSQQQYYDAPQAYIDNRQSTYHNDQTVPPTPGQYDSAQHQYPYKSPESQPMIGTPVYKETIVDAKPRKRICGMKTWVCVALFVLVFLVVGAVVGVGVAVSSKKSSSKTNPSNSTATTSTSSTTSSATSTGTPLAVAAAGINSGDAGTPITLIFQDVDTHNLYINAHSDNDWSKPIQISGLDPAPKANSPLATLQFPNATDIQLFYLADNNTMFNAVGRANESVWDMGPLGEETNYAVLVSNNTGITAAPWMVTSEQDYSSRVYYIGQEDTKWHELAQDPGYNWVQTAQTGTEAVMPGSQMALAWLPGVNFTDTSNQELHIFYQDPRNKLRHQFSQNGNWNTSNVESLATFASAGHIAATIFPADLGSTLNVFWLAGNPGSSGKLTAVTGAGTKTGTFGSASSISGVDTAASAGGPISAISWLNNIRVYYQSLTNPGGLDENSVDGSKGSPQGSTIAS